MKQWTSVLWAVASVGVASSIVGCVSDPMRAPPTGRQDPFPGREYPRVAIEQPLNQYLVPDYDRIVVDSPSPDRPMRVQVPVRSQSDSSMYVQYQFQWYDAEGRHIRDSGWKSVNIDPRLQVQLAANALDSKSADWRLEVRSAR
jgi:Protein of unknown function (DUF1425)